MGFTIRAGKSNMRKGKKKKNKRTKEHKKKRYCGVINLIFCGKVFLMRFSVSNEEGQKGVGGFQQILTDLVGCHSGLSFFISIYFLSLLMFLNLFTIHVFCFLVERGQDVRCYGDDYG